MTEILSTLSKHPHIWRAREKKNSEAKFSLGFARLDSALNGGVASSGLVRISSLTGVGELSLFKHVLCKHRTHKMVVFINPPGQLQAPWLANLGLDLQQVLVVNTPADQESLWAAEQCLKSTACHCVILWSNRVCTKAARRLQVAATHNDALCLLYTLPQCANVNHEHGSMSHALPITLELSLQAHASTVTADVRKQRHGWPTSNITISHNWTPDNHAIKWAMEHNKLADHALHSVN